MPASNNPIEELAALAPSHHQMHRSTSLLNPQQISPKTLAVVRLLSTTTMAAAVARSVLAIHSTSITTASLVSKRLFSSTVSKPPPLPSFTRPASTRSASSPFLSQSLRVITPRINQLNIVRCRVNHSGSAYSPLNSGSNFSDRPPIEMASLFQGCDYEHWLIVMDKPGGEGAIKQ